MAVKTNGGVVAVEPCGNLMKTPALLP